MDEDEDEAQRERCLPQHCWLQMLEQLPVREVCMLARVNRAEGRALARCLATGRVTCLAFDEQLLVSGCSQAGLKVWSMDELKCSRSLRGHEGAITGVGILGHGMVVSGGEDGHIKVWDAASAGAVLDLDCGQPCGALQVHPASGQLVCSGYGVQLWDLSAAQLLHTLELGPDSGPLASQPGASTPGPDIHPGLHLQPNHPTHDLAPGV
ncbi:uncharacterized protein HaLaN_24018, partial [Haematococcus lacustris]